MNKRKKVDLPDIGYEVVTTLLENYDFLKANSLKGTELSVINAAVQEAIKMMKTSESRTIKKYCSILNEQYFKEPDVEDLEDVLHKTISDRTRVSWRKPAISIFGYYVLILLKFKSKDPGVLLNYALDNLEMNGYPIPEIDRQMLADYENMVVRKIVFITKKDTRSKSVDEPEEEMQEVSETEPSAEEENEKGEDLA